MKTVKTPRLEERIISKMRKAGLLVTEAIEEQVYVEVFNGRASDMSDAVELFAECKRLVAGEVEAVTKPRDGELS